MVRHRVSLRTDLAADLPRVSGDPVQLQRVLINLVMNGVDAMRALTDRKRELLIKSAKNHNEVFIQVQDSGEDGNPCCETRCFVTRMLWYGGQRPAICPPNNSPQGLESPANLVLKDYVFQYTRLC
jgi:hypothetical protein